MELLSDHQLLRYSRNILLPDVDVDGQETLLKSHIAVVGAGGLGSPILQYLAASGVGTLTIIDDDIVEETNLQRQVIFDESQIGQSKAECAGQTLKQMNRDIRVTCRTVRLSEDNATELLSGSDLVIVGTDNYSSRVAVSHFCCSQSLPMVSGAAIGASGQICSFDFRLAESACYQCLYPKAPQAVTSCSQAGVFGPVVGVIGSMMAMEAIKLLLNIGSPLLNRLLVWDALAMEWQSFHYSKSLSCPACGVPEHD